MHRQKQSISTRTQLQTWFLNAWQTVG